MSASVAKLDVPVEVEGTDALMAETNKALEERLKETEKPPGKPNKEEENDDSEKGKSFKKPASKTKVSEQFRWLLYASEGTRELDQNKTIKDTRPTVATYKLTVKCTSLDTTEKAVLAVKVVPTTLLALYREVESLVQCPFSLIEIFFKGEKLQSTESITLTSLGINESSLLDVTYKGKCDLEEVRVLFSWYRYISMFMRGRLPSIYDGITSEVGLVVKMGLDEMIAEELAYEKFQPPGSLATWCNKIYFIQNQGLQYLLDVLEQLLMEPWNTMLICLKYVEIGCLHVMSQLGSEKIFQMKVEDDEGFNFCIQSMTRVPLHLCPVITDYLSTVGCEEYNNHILKDLISAGLLVLESFRLRPKPQVEMISQTNLLEQLLAIIHCRSFTAADAISVLSVLTCCAMHQPDQLKHLAGNVMVDGLMKTCVNRKEMGADPDEVMLLHFYTNMYMCILLVNDFKHLDLTLARIKRIQSHLEEFSSMADAKVIARMEKAAKGRLGWVDYLPLLQLIYNCRFPEDIREAMKTSGKEVAVKLVYLSSIHQQNMKTLAVAFEAMLIRDGVQKAADTLIETDILDYVQCIQRIQNKSHRVFYDKCMATLWSGPPLPVPKLQNLVKVRLARTWLDLDSVRKMTAEEMKEKLTPPPSKVPPPQSPSDAVFCVVAMPGTYDLLKSLTNLAAK